MRYLHEKSTAGAADGKDGGVSAVDLLRLTDPEAAKALATRNKEYVPAHNMRDILKWAADNGFSSKNAVQAGRKDEILRDLLEYVSADQDLLQPERVPELCKLWSGLFTELLRFPQRDEEAEHLFREQRRGGGGGTSAFGMGMGVGNGSSSSSSSSSASAVRAKVGNMILDIPEGETVSRNSVPTARASRVPQPQTQPRYFTVDILRTILLHKMDDEAKWPENVKQFWKVLHCKADSRVINELWKTSRYIFHAYDKDTKKLLDKLPLNEDVADGVLRCTNGVLETDLVNQILTTPTKLKSTVTWERFNTAFGTLIGGLGSGKIGCRHDDLEFLKKLKEAANFGQKESAFAGNVGFSQSFAE